MNYILPSFNKISRSEITEFKSSLSEAFVDQQREIIEDSNEGQKLGIFSLCPSKIFSLFV